jgi:hypothetical protein
MAAAPAAMDLVSLRENTCGLLSWMPYLTVAAHAEPALEATRKLAEGLAGVG